MPSCALSQSSRRRIRWQPRFRALRLCATGEIARSQKSSSKRCGTKEARDMPMFDTEQISNWRHGILRFGICRAWLK
jgi:hypothetical protein